MSETKESTRRPLAAGAKRNLLIIGGALAGGIVLVAGVALVANKAKQKPESTADLRPMAAPAGSHRNRDVDELSPAMKQRIAYVQQDEAQAARREGRTYLGDTADLGPKQPVGGKNPDPSQQGQGAGATPYQQYGARSSQLTGQASPGVAGDTNRQAELEHLQKGLERQLGTIVNAMAPAKGVAVAIATDERKTTVAAVADGDSMAAAVPAAKGTQLVAGLEIFPGQLASPVDTDKSKYISAYIVGGKLDGAFLTGEAVLSAQGEDVSAHMTSMNWKGKSYKVDAVLLNEQTASDALNADIDHRPFSRFVMPVLVAGLAGASTYFTARGTTATSYVPGTVVVGGTTVNGNAVVQQPSPSSSQALDQGIGKGIEKSMQLADRETQRYANRPNRGTLDARTSIGVLFRQPVMATN
ncbi:DotG/IcmE/VirB10 family protein [Cupriavidus sp. TMH.W2]|uniref:DotG/IcmE/VirB10 family protein n=1 Tax=Cupriavidus sp. TMH.W2 TaxID=3434465 RepID=UPI003D7851FF